MKRRRFFPGPGDEPNGEARELPLSAAEGPPDVSPPQSRRGEIGVFTGGVTIAASIIAGHPDYGAGVFGPWWIAGIALGLVAVGAGLVAVLQHSILPATIKAAVVAITVTAVAAFAFVGVELLPTTLPSCGTVERPTLENRGPVYCKEGNGTVVRMSISSVELCPDGHFIADFNIGERGGIWPLYSWLETGVASPGVCRL